MTIDDLSKQDFSTLEKAINEVAQTKAGKRLLWSYSEQWLAKDWPIGFIISTVEAMAKK